MPLRGEVVYLFAFDIGQEVVAAAAESRFPRRGEPLDPRRRPTVPPDTLLYRPLSAAPVVEADSDRAGAVTLDARVYEAGAVTVTATTPFAVDSLSELHTRHLAPSRDPLFDTARQVCERVRSTLGDAVRGPTDMQGPEVYTAFVISDLGGGEDAGRWVDDHRPEVAGLLTNLPGDTLSDSHLTDSLHHRGALQKSDTVVIDWDAALVIDLAGGVGEVLYVLEVANLQLLEWKVLDAVLDRHLTQAYDHFARRSTMFSLGWGRVLRDLRQLRADAAKLTDEVSNTGKFIGDWYLARVYQAAKERFHLDGWRASVDHRLSQLDRIYAAMQAEVNDRRMLWLELLIVLLIAVELLLSLFVHRG